MSRIDEIRKRLEEATPGPWHVMETGFGRGRGNPTVYATNEDLNYVAKCADFACIHGKPRNLENAAFIANAPSDIAYLLEEVERLTKERDDNDRVNCERCKVQTARRCAEIAQTGCLVPPDGGSPTPEEADMCDHIAAAIRKEFGV